MSGARGAKVVRQMRRINRVPLSQRQRNQVKKMMTSNMEEKHHDTHFNITVSSTGTVSELSNMTQGDTELTYDGIEFSPKRLEFRVHSANADTVNTIRCIIFRWKPDTNVDAPTVAKVIEAGAGADNPFYPLLWENRGKIAILDDFLLSTASGGPGNVSRVRKLRKGFAKVKATATGKFKNSIWLLLISDSGSASHPSFVGSFKLIITDN